MVALSQKREQKILGFLRQRGLGKAPGATAEERSQFIADCAAYIRSKTNESSSEAVGLSRRFVRRCERMGGADYSLALRAHGWASLVAGKYLDSLKAYLAARKRMRTDEVGRARIDRTLIDVQMYLGRYKESVRRANMAIAVFSKHKLSDDLAKTWLNLGNVHHRNDDHVSARSLYQKAAKRFEKTGQDYATALCWYNLANTLVQLVDFDAGKELYEKARAIFEELGDQLHATGCLYGLAWTDMLCGDFKPALAKLSESEAYYRVNANHRELVLCQLDRAESFLGLNLYSDALTAAIQAERGAKRLGIEYESAKAAFFIGKSHMGLGNHRKALPALKRARAAFEKIGNIGFKAATVLAEALIEQSPEKRLREVKSARDMFAKAQLPLWEAVSAVEFAAAQSSDSALARKLLRSPALDDIPHLSARRFTILGDIAAREKNMKQAAESWTKAANIYDAVREKLPPYELGGRVIRPDENPFESLVSFYSETDAAQAAVWAERLKSVGIWTLPQEFYNDNPSRKKVQERLEHLAGRYAAVSDTLSKTAGRRLLDASASGAAQVREQSAVRQGVAMLHQRSDTWGNNNKELQSQIEVTAQEIPIIQFCVCRSDIYGFVHHGNTVYGYKYCNGAERLSLLTARWRFLVECSAARSRTSRPADIVEEERVLSEIDRWLISPLQIPTSSKRIVIVPDGQLYSLPWMAIGGRDNPLSERFLFTISPTLRHFVHSRKQHTESSDSRIFVGDSSRLPAVRKEIESVASKVSPDAIKVFDPCQRTDWPLSGSAQFWHFAGHAHLRADNPFFSSLRLVDGEIFAADFRLRRCKVNLVTLAACRTGQYSSAPDQEALGLVRSLLEMGARNVVAGNWGVADDTSAEWMDHFYDKFLRGEDPATAASHAARRVRDQHTSVFHWGAFTVFGAD